ncbi:glucuronoxylan 4-O-methyltransferase 2-like [Alnus glutinosa]|uniref:glucuronoxylan 4-O-methyltransferase 2-like n=1 Tax=Alnus glutinosa TaxID=3517 RepID=UPI002D773282|nr:glucuronoxylan 4-O-methyltransferase 2-like [Alnus glutinosa]
MAMRSCVEFELEWLRLLKDIHRKPVLPMGQLPPMTYDSEDEVLKSRAPCNFLFFGLGHDSLMQLQRPSDHFNSLQPYSSISFPCRTLDRDMIMIEVLCGYFAEAPGQISAILSTAVMARNRKGSCATQVFLHDVDRKVEKTYVEFRVSVHEEPS